MREFHVTLNPAVRRLAPILFALLMLSGTLHAGGAAPAAAGWDQNSWRDIISDECQAFFDGCNNCRRGSADITMAACTRKACAEYQKPRCLDEEANVTTDTRPVSKTIEYSCAGSNTFSVAYHEYIQDDQRVMLSDSEVMFSDHQTHNVYRLQRQVSASGEKYSDAAGFMFFARGGEAMVQQQQTRLYRDCVITR
jgi:membrane-bound inhibitor of C-type lysozyme